MSHSFFGGFNGIVCVKAFYKLYNYCYSRNQSAFLRCLFLVEITL